MMLNAVLDEAYDQHQTAARRDSGKALQHGIIGGGELVQTAVGRHHGYSKPLQEIATQGASDRADEGVTDKSETVLLGGRRRKVCAKYAGDYLNNKIGRRPDHPALPAFQNLRHSGRECEQAKNLPSSEPLIHRRRRFAYSTVDREAFRGQIGTLQARKGERNGQRHITGGVYCDICRWSGLRAGNVREQGSRKRRQGSRGGGKDI